MEQDLVAVRIRDGIFVGNASAAQDREFLSLNKISHIVNCAGSEVPNYYMDEATLKYLSFQCADTPAGTTCTTALLDPQDENINSVVKFIDEATASGNCVLVHSLLGMSRSPAMIAAYFIDKYGWKLDSVQSFLEMAHPDVCIKPHYLRQLRTFAKRHHVDIDIFDKDTDDSGFGLDNDQWMLRNTLLNGLTYEDQRINSLYIQCCRKTDIGVVLQKTTASRRRPRITFVDTERGTNYASPTSSPVVAPSQMSIHVDPASGVRSPSNQCIGSHGVVALRSPRSPSILSRTSSVCTRALESDPQTYPKGRQELHVVGATCPHSHETPVNVTIEHVEQGNDKSINADDTNMDLTTKGPLEEVSTPNLDAATPAVSSASTTPNVSSSVASKYKVLAPPPRQTGAGVTGSGRSPYAGLSSSHQYRNGSPRPNSKEIGSTKSGRTKISSSPCPSKQKGPPSVVNPSRTGSRTRTSSPSGIPSAAAGSSTVRRNAVSRGATSYAAIAPQRSGSSRPLVLKTVDVEGNSSVNAKKAVNSPTEGLGGSVPRKRSGSLGSKPPPAAPKERSSSHRGREISSSDDVGQQARVKSNGSVLRRQPPTAITSYRK